MTIIVTRITVTAIIIKTVIFRIKKNHKNHKKNNNNYNNAINGNNSKDD